MKGSISNYFSVGTLQWMSYPKRDPIEALLTIAGDDFFDAVEVAGFGERRAEARAILEQSHLRVCLGAQPRLLSAQLNPNAVDETERLKAEGVLLEAVDEAEYLGAEGVAFLSGKWKKETREQAYAQLLKTTRNVCGYAAEKGLNVELEVFDFNVDKASLIGPAPYAARFAADMRMTYNNFGLIVDLSHIPITHETSQFVIRTLRPYITHLHFGNAVVEPGRPGYGDKHPRFGYPNSANDTNELLDYLSVLKQEGFFNAENPYILSMEVTPQSGENEDIILANTKRVLRCAWTILPEHDSGT